MTTTKAKAAPNKSAAKSAAKSEKKKAGSDAKSETITLVAKKCPSAAGTVRAERWAKLKSGMTIAEAVAAGVPQIYLRRMAARGHLTLSP